MQPVYPRPNPEYEKAVYDQLVRRLRAQGWRDIDDTYCSRKGRNPKQTKLPDKVKPRFKDGYNWFD